MGKVPLKLAMMQALGMHHAMRFHAQAKATKS
jgi:hypothetical protein